MNIKKINKICAMCKKEHSYNEILSNFCSGSPDLDLKPNGSMMQLGDEIQMCPDCNYCNYDVSELFNPKIQNLEDWQAFKDVQEEINSNHDIRIKKFLIMAYQYFEKDDYNHAYNMILSASWVAENNEDKIELKNDAYKFFNLYILPKHLNQLFQVVDTVRQVGNFDEAKKILEACNSLLNKNSKDYKILSKLSKFQNELINNKDTSRHNLSEAK